MQPGGGGEGRVGGMGREGNWYAAGRGEGRRGGMGGEEGSGEKGEEKGEGMTGEGGRRGERASGGLIVYPVHMYCVVCTCTSVESACNWIETRVQLIYLSTY